MIDRWTFLACRFLLAITLAGMPDAKTSSAKFWRETLALYKTASTTEKSYYPAIQELWSRLLESRDLPFEVRVETSEHRSGATGADAPDLALYDRGEFVSVLTEVKPPAVGIEDMAVSVERKDPIGRYLAQTGVVLLCNVRAVGLLVCKPGYVRRPGTPVPPHQRDLLDPIPRAVWRYELGGYPVLEKWLGYRQASRRNGQPLTLVERQHFRSMIQRIAAFLVLHEAADALYEKAAARPSPPRSLACESSGALSQQRFPRSRISQTIDPKPPQ